MSDPDGTRGEVPLEGTVLHELFGMLQKWTVEVAEGVDNGLDRIEGRRFLLRVLALSVENYIEGWDPDAPHFRQTVSDIRKVFADSPDTDYLRSNMYLRGGRIFRIHGTIPPTTLYWGVQLYRAGGLVGKNLPDTEIPLGADGSFEVFVIPPDVPPPPYMAKKTVLVGDGDEVSVIVRQYFTDRLKEPPMRLHIERLPSDAASLKTLKMPHVDVLSAYTGQGRMQSSDFARGSRLVLSDISAVVQKTLLAHQYLSSSCDFKFVVPEAKQLFPTNDNRYTLAWVHGLEKHLGRNDYPVVLARGTRPKTRYFSVVLYNRWLESLDYTRAIVYRNHTKIFFQPDGTFEVAISQRNPGHRNWLCTTHHDGLYVLFRELLPDPEVAPVFEIELTTAKKLQARRDRTYLVAPGTSHL